MKINCKLGYYPLSFHRMYQSAFLNNMLAGGSLSPGRPTERSKWRTAAPSGDSSVLHAVALIGKAEKNPLSMERMVSKWTR